jgi:hypothetical protein
MNADKESFKMTTIRIGFFSNLERFRLPSRLLPDGN